MEVMRRARVLAGEDNADEITVHHIQAALSRPDLRPHDRQTPVADMPLSADAKRVLKLATASATDRKSVTVDHLRAALMREIDGI